MITSRRQARKRRASSTNLEQNEKVMENINSTEAEDENPNISRNTSDLNESTEQVVEKDGDIKNIKNAKESILQKENNVANENHLLEMRTLAGNTFRNLLDTLKAVLNDANIIFTEKGLKLAAVDTKRHALVHLFMDASSFQFYHCKQKLTLGVDIDSLHRTMKTNKSNDLMCFIVRKDNPGFLDVFFENSHKGTKVFDRLKLLSLKEYNITDKIVYRTPVPEMDSQLLQSICREMSSFQATLL
jgi:hypothetical protein